MALSLRPGSIEFQLEDAITKGDTTGVKSLLTLLDAATRDALLSAPLDQAGSTALHLASDRDEVYVVHILLDALARADKVRSRLELVRFYKAPFCCTIGDQ
jgi:hypothetical protein